jgi:CRISPR-associated endonuclease Csy4
MKYLELKIVPRGGVTFGFVMRKVFTELHGALVDKGDGMIGLSFPKYSVGDGRVGNIIRAFAKSEEDLKRMSLQHRMRRLSDYVEISDVRDVPCCTPYERFSRAKGFSINAYIRRRMKRHGETREQAEAIAKKAMAARKTNHPFIMVDSSSTGQRAFVHVKRSTAKDEGDWKFNSYGLSNTAAVPAF